MMDLNQLIRKNIRELQPYHSAREEHQDTGFVYLDANENPFGRSLNRYPDPLQKALREKIGRQHSVDPAFVFTGNGSDEIIDLLVRAFLEPGKDKVVVPDPSYGMYEVAAAINGVNVSKVSLSGDFQPDPARFLEEADANTKMIFLCSPNNPTGNLFAEANIRQILGEFEGLVVVDEAYIEFAESHGLLHLLDQYPNLVVMRTLSKAAGLAGIRLGYAFADPRIITVLTKIKYPYNVNRLSQRMALKRLDRSVQLSKVVRLIRKERDKLASFLDRCGFVDQVYPSDANFLLVKVQQPQLLIPFLKDEGIIIRDRSRMKLLDHCVRITVGKPRENKRLMKACLMFDQKNPEK